MTAAENSDTRRKRILWRATHRGIKEMDLIVGGFTQVRLAGMNESERDYLADLRVYAGQYARLD